jgi:4-carboxymuconolactone decarboxylase
MARIPPATRDGVPADQQAAFDEIIQMQAQGTIPSGGPLAIMINVPEMMKRGEHLRAYLRGEPSSLTLRIRELTMILTAREMDCPYIWYAHAAQARRAGVRDDIVDSLRERQELAELAPDEAIVVAYGRELLRTRQVSQGTFDAALAQFGTRGLIELTNLMGYYTLLAFNINAFGATPPDDASEPSLPVLDT